MLDYGMEDRVDGTYNSLTIVQGLPVVVDGAYASPGNAYVGKRTFLSSATMVEGLTNHRASEYSEYASDPDTWISWKGDTESKEIYTAIIMKIKTDTNFDPRSVVFDYIIEHYESFTRSYEISRGECEWKNGEAWYRLNTNGFSLYNLKNVGFRLRLGAWHVGVSAGGDTYGFDILDLYLVPQKFEGDAKSSQVCKLQKIKIDYDTIEKIIVKFLGEEGFVGIINISQLEYPPQEHKTFLWGDNYN